MKKLLILDSNSIINRAFYGIRFLSAPDGTPTNGVYGFMNILFKLLNEEKPDYLCAAFDVSQPTFRHKMYGEYKAQRKPMPDGLRVQMPLAKDILRAMNVPILELGGYEADDIIGTVSRKCEREAVECLIATGDKDDLQLATDKTKVILTVSRSGVSETVVYDDKAVFEKYGVTPSEFIDVKALMGDQSDNVPGVAGIGEKTALKLIREFSSIERLYEDLDGSGLKGAALEKLKNGRQSAFMSKTLCTIDTAVPLDFSFEECEYTQSFNNDELYEILNRLGLNSFIKKLGLSGAAQNEAAADFFDSMQTVSVSDAQQAEELYNKLREAQRAAVLVRFDGEKICGLALAYESCAAYIKPCAGISSDALERLAVKIINDKDIEKITFDIKETLVRLGDLLKPEGITGDCAIAAYLVNPAKSRYEIDDICMEQLGINVTPPQTKSVQLSLLDDEPEDSGDEVFCRQAFALLPLWDKLSGEMDKLGQTQLYREIELPLITVLASMQSIGFRIDRSRLKSFGERMQQDIDRLTQEIYELAGEEFNINSPKQLGTILFEKLSLPVIKKSKTGYSTNADILEKLSGKHPIINLITEFRTVSKLKSTYCDGLDAAADSSGKIHSVFNQTVTVTGRISSSEPNLQNIPVRTQLGRELRKMFVASDDEHILVDADYSQIELRVLAHIADDKTMTDAFNSGEDIHAVTASQVFGVPLSQVTREQRSSAKAVNFGIVYGIGEYSLSQDLKISVKQAKQYIESYLEKYDGVRAYMSEIKEQAKRDGYVKTMFNRIRYIPELSSGNYNTRAFGERVALNTPIQGTAADIIKLAMVRVYSRLKKEGLKSRLILQVHDELIIDTLRSEQAQVEALLREEMENAVKLRVPLVADTAAGESWYDAK